METEDRLDSSGVFLRVEEITALTNAELQALHTLHESGLLRKVVKFRLVPDINKRMLSAAAAGEGSRCTLYAGQIQGLETVLLDYLESVSKDWAMTKGGRFEKKS